MKDDEKAKAFEKFRTPFPESVISQKPNPTRAETEAIKNNYNLGIRCEKCGQWHHPKTQHLSYVGHAALTARLNECFPDDWSWNPLALGPNGLPVFDDNGGLWIVLEIAGRTMLGYGDAPGKSGGNAIKEAIGDALRNAAMRFGAALDLWFKGDMPESTLAEEDQAQPDAPAAITAEQAEWILSTLQKYEGDEAGFLKYMKVKCVTDILADDMKKVEYILNQKRIQWEGKKK